MPKIFKNRLLPIISVLTLSLFILCAYQIPDTDIIQYITNKLEKYQENYRQDKVYLHTDRKQYTTGETVWLKAYQVNASTHQPHALSKVLYIELINTEKKIVLKQKVKIEGGYGYGQFSLPTNLSTGHYIVRAYNNWMRNFDTDFFFTKSIHITNLNPGETPVSTPIAGNQVDLQFFPEGGYLVNGLQSTVAFKALSSSGEGINIEGVITDQSKDTITSFKGFYVGMGTFDLKPITGKTYTAHIRLPDEEIATYPLPKALEAGTVMHIGNTSEESFKVNLQTANLQSNQGALILQSRGTIYFSTPVNFSTKPAIDIPKNNLPDGISHISLFDTKGNIQCERLVFINRQNNLHIQVNSNKKVYAPREKVMVEITVRDKSGNPVSSANLSMAVIEANQPTDAEVNSSSILSYMLLSSDLKGTIEQPGFYFSESPKAKQALDNLMLTQGWRRFVWKEIINNNFFPEPEYEMEDGIPVNGRLLNAANKTPAANQLITLSVPGAVPPFQQQYTDLKGNFYFPDFQFFEDKELFLQPPIVEGQSFIIELDSTLQAPVNNVVSIQSQLPLTAQQAAYVEKSRNRAKIEAVYQSQPDSLTATTALSTRNKASQNTLIDVPADHIIALDKFNEFPDMTEVLREIVPGILLKDKKGVNSLRVLDIKRKMYFKEEAVYFIDGIPTTDANTIFKLDPGMVEVIEVYGRPEKLARFDQLGKNGIVAIFTRTRDYYPGDKQNLYTMSFKGYIQAREFYAPVYENTNSSRKPDFRPLLYWNPKVTTDAEGKAKISFYNADNIGSHQISIEGISGQGLPGAARYSYQVNLPLQSGR